MKAAVIDRFGGPEEIYYTDIEKPVPGPDEVLVKNIYIGVGKPALCNELPNNSRHSAQNTVVKEE